MVGETGTSDVEAGSGVEPPIEQRVRRALALFERFAPAIGSRWAVELWCTPPAVEMSLRMPPGVTPGEPVEAAWSGHRIAGEARGASADSLVFLAPMGDFSWYLDVFADRHGFGPRIRRGLHRRLDRRLKMPLYDTDIAAVAANLNDPPPLLVVHDPDDPDSPCETSQTIVDVWPGASLVTTRGLGRLAHYRILRHRPAINAGVEFIGRANGEQSTKPSEVGEVAAAPSPAD